MSGGARGSFICFQTNNKENCGLPPAFCAVRCPCAVKLPVLFKGPLCLPSNFLRFHFWARFMFPSPSSFDRVSRCPFRWPDRPWPNDGFASGSCGSCLRVIAVKRRQTNSIYAVKRVRQLRRRSCQKMP